MNSSIDGENRVNTYNASKQQALAFHKRFLSSYLLLFTFIDNKNSEYDQEIPQSQTTDNPMAPGGRATQPTRKTNEATSSLFPIKMIATLEY